VRIEKKFAKKTISKKKEILKENYIVPWVEKLKKEKN